MHLFGRARSKPNAKEAIVRLRETQQMLQKRETFLQTKIDTELKLAKANATKNKRAAIAALKRKKQYEGQIDKISGARMTIETQMMAIESANINLETMNAMKSGAQAIKEIHGSMSIEQVDKTMDDIRDQMDLADEISNAIAQPLAFGAEIDEDELNAELEELEQEELDEKLLGVEAPPIFVPKVPAAEIGTSMARQREGYGDCTATLEEDHEAELEKLRAEMAI
ncbi:Snf7-domain-containing protein [Thamnocephalis sphaerospora]|uniref:Vacuolar-sorting protein SNF7 n=1 Tax=Thamnocephalis sphaerospora TaxID=78915 RepID=A0A4P9XN63_9FUNG|nr:Snf7-domain-containing protein [Thamnocephalis sphaerospora]|eukprot:RKP07262.1 Snf7-domain-containing protein [Thamnocephalis sphaerospora]